MFLKTSLNDRPSEGELESRRVTGMEPPHNPWSHPERVGAVGMPVTRHHRVAGGGHPPPAPTERSVQISRTALFRNRFTA